MYFKCSDATDALVQFYVPAVGKDIRVGVAEAAAMVIWRDWLDWQLFFAAGKDSLDIDLYDNDKNYLFSAEVKVVLRDPILDAKIK